MADEDRKRLVEEIAQAHEGSDAAFDVSAALLIAPPPGKASRSMREKQQHHSGNEIRSNQGPNGIEERVCSSSAHRALHEHGEFLAVRTHSRTKVTGG